MCDTHYVFSSILRNSSSYLNFQIPYIPYFCPNVQLCRKQTTITRLLDKAMDYHENCVDFCCHHVYSLLVSYNMILRALVQILLARTFVSLPVMEIFEETKCAIKWNGRS